MTTKQKNQTIMNPISEITIPVRFETTEDGHIKSITVVEQLPDAELSFLLNFLSDLNKSKSPSPEIS